MSRWLAIVNPCSGQYESSGFDLRWMPRLKQFAERVVYTDSAGAASTIASESADVDGIVVVGGDGTIFEVIGGMDREHQHLAVIPTGRGNCLARDLGIRRVTDGFRVLRDGADKQIDLMQASATLSDGSRATYLSASTIALGYVVSVVDRASDFRSAGPYGYALATLVTRPSTFSCRLAIADRVIDALSCTGIVINNTVHLANFAAFADARMQDGLMDVLVLDVGWIRQTIHNLSILSTMKLYDPGDRSQSDSVRVSMSLPQTLMIDGQLYAGVTDLSVVCLPATLRCRQISRT